MYLDPALHGSRPRQYERPPRSGSSASERVFPVLSFDNCGTTSSGQVMPSWRRLRRCTARKRAHSKPLSC